jgi:hypothetical protein
VAIKKGDALEVTWSADVTVPPPTVTCNGDSQQLPSEAMIQPFLLVEPRTFTLPATGGTQNLAGGIPGVQNTGTMTVTRRETCGEKVTQVNTSPPGQATSASSMVGKAFGVGEKVTADTDVEFVYEDGSVMRLAKGASYMETAECDSSIDKSRSFKGTLLMGRIWARVTRVFGDRDYAMKRCYEYGKWGTTGSGTCERTVNGVRGTTFWIVPTRKTVSYTVSEGSIWVQGVTASNKPVSRRIVVKAGHTLVLSKSAKPVLRKTRASDAFPFG